MGKPSMEKAAKVLIPTIKTRERYEVFLLWQARSRDQVLQETVVGQKNTTQSLLNPWVFDSSEFSAFSRNLDPYLGLRFISSSTFNIRAHPQVQTRSSLLACLYLSTHQLQICPVSFSLLVNSPKRFAYRYIKSA